MLGIRLSADEEERLASYARQRGRPKSAVAREWIVERLERDEVDERIRVAAALHAQDQTPESRQAALDASNAFIRWLDAVDGGYDWGPQGPPDVK